jgi:FlaA1/EpsC-like NDP-sugar epimerase
LGLSELRQITIGLLQAALMLIGFWLVAGGALPRPNVIICNLFTSLVFLSGFRFLLRLWRERTESQLPPAASLPVRVGIIGASSLGAQLAQCLLTQKHLGRVPVAFFDDDFVKWQKHVHQVPVVGMPECLLQGWIDKLDEVAIALPNASPARLQQIYQFLSGTGLKIYSLEWPWPARTDQKQKEGQ